MASMSCFSLLTQQVTLAASRTFCTAGNKQADQDGDDGDHHEKFDQRERGTMHALGHDRSPQRNTFPKKILREGVVADKDRSYDFLKCVTRDTCYGHEFTPPFTWIV